MGPSAPSSPGGISDQYATTNWDKRDHCLTVTGSLISSSSQFSTISLEMFSRQIYLLHDSYTRQIYLIARQFLSTDYLDRSIYCMTDPILLLVDSNLLYFLSNQYRLLLTVSPDSHSLILTEHNSSQGRFGFDCQLEWDKLSPDMLVKSGVS